MANKSAGSPPGSKVLGSENIPTSGAILVPSRLHFKDLLLVEKILAGRTLAFLLEQNAQISPLLQAHSRKSRDHHPRLLRKILAGRGSQKNPLRPHPPRRNHRLRPLRGRRPTRIDHPRPQPNFETAGRHESPHRPRFHRPPGRTRPLHRSPPRQIPHHHRIRKNPRKGIRHPRQLPGIPPRPRRTDIQQPPEPRRKPRLRPHPRSQKTREIRQNHRWPRRVGTRFRTPPRRRHRPRQGHQETHLKTSRRHRPAARKRRPHRQCRRPLRRKNPGEPQLHRRLREPSNRPSARPDLDRFITADPFVRENAGVSPGRPTAT